MGGEARGGNVQLRGVGMTSTDVARLELLELLCGAEFIGHGCGEGGWWVRMERMAGRRDVNGG